MKLYLVHLPDDRKRLPRLTSVTVAANSRDEAEAPAEEPVRE
jgi:hypothetical protein